MSLVRNTFFYGLSRLSRSAVYLVVAWKLGLSAQADSFLLAYAVALFFLTKATFLLGEVEVGRLEKADLRIVLGLSLLALLLVPFPLVSYVLFGVLGSYLSGILATRGKPLLGPLTSILSSFIFILLVLLSFDLFTALLISEVFHALPLLPFVSYGRVPFSFLLSPMKYLPSFSLIGLVPLLARVYAGGLGEGNIALFSYSNAVFNYLISFLTAGIVITLSVNKVGIEEGWAILERSRSRLLFLSAALTSISLFIYFFSHSSFFLILTLLLPGLFSYTLAHTAFAILSVARIYFWVLVSSAIYLVLFSFLSTLLSGIGLPGIALALTISSGILTVLLMIRVWREKESRSRERERGEEVVGVMER